MRDKISSAEVHALVHGWHDAPHEVLGLHATGTGMLRFGALLPCATRVDLIDALKDEVVASLRLRDSQGYFEAPLRRKKPFAYRLGVTWDTGETGEYHDAYAFAAQLDMGEIAAFQRGEAIRAQDWLGAHVQQRMHAGESVNGVSFVVWAPNAKRVSVVGNFNNWDGRRHRLRPALGHGGAATGLWELWVPHASVGDLYKFEITGPDGVLLPLKADPFARAAQLRPETASVVSPELPRLTSRVGRQGANSRHAPISIYEVHLGSWRKGENGRFLSWDELAQQLPDYAAGLGYTHVELMPITEHPFDGSWGYQTLGMFAPTARFGDAEGLKRFVNACHDKGIGVLLDWVPAHFPVDGHGLAHFDGTALFEYADPKEGFHRDWNTFIYNFDRWEVRSFLVSSALYWIERFGFDGLRIDAVASMLYRDYSRPSGEWIPNHQGGRENLEAISLLKRINEVIGTECPHAITMAEESTSFPQVSAPTFEGGLGFHFKWNMGWMNDTLKYMHQDPVHRSHHHSQMTFGLVYAFSEKFVLPLSHDEVVHGKGSLLDKMPGDDWQKFANLRAYLGFMWGHPGKKLLFMGQEFAQRGEWQAGVELPWALTEHASHRGMQHLVKDLNQLMRQHPALYTLDADPRGFEWIALEAKAESVLAWIRKDADGQQMVVVSNLTPVPRPGYRLGLPSGPSAWVEALNTDSSYYGGSNMGNGIGPLPVESVASHGRTHSTVLTLPPLSTVFLKPTP